MSKTRRDKHKKTVLIKRSNKFINRLIDSGRVTMDKNYIKFVGNNASEDGLKYLNDNFKEN